MVADDPRGIYSVTYKESLGEGTPLPPPLGVDEDELCPEVAIMIRARSAGKNTSKIPTPGQFSGGLGSSRLRILEKVAFIEDQAFRLPRLECW